jgi:hypothetical protein
MLRCYRGKRKGPLPEWCHSLRITVLFERPPGQCRDHKSMFTTMSLHLVVKDLQMKMCQLEQPEIIVPQTEQYSSVSAVTDGCQLPIQVSRVSREAATHEPRTTSRIKKPLHFWNVTGFGSLRRVPEARRHTTIETWGGKWTEYMQCSNLIATCD